MLNLLKKLSLISAAMVLLMACGQSAEPQINNKSSDKNNQESISKNVNNPEIELCKLTMGWEPWAPYHYEDQNREVMGLDIDMMEILQKETGCEISYQKGDWKTLLLALKNGKIDILTGVSINDKRKEYARFSDGYRSESFRLFVRAGEISKFSGNNMKAFIDNGFRLGITMDYLYSDEITELQDDPANSEKIIAVSSGLINFAKLLEETIDGFLEDPIVGQSSIRRQGIEKQIEMHPYEIITGDVHLMFSKLSVEEKIIVRFNQALAKIRDDGQHQKLMDKYVN